MTGSSLFKSWTLMSVLLLYLFPHPLAISCSSMTIPKISSDSYTFASNGQKFIIPYLCLSHPPPATFRPLNHSIIHLHVNTLFTFDFLLHPFYEFSCYAYISIPTIKEKGVGLITAFWSGFSLYKIKCTWFSNL
jgi:hypothetical protein